MIADHESHLLPPRIKPCGEMLLAFDFPARPTPVCTSFQLSCGASLPDCHRQSFICMAFPVVSLLQVCIGSLVPPAGGVGGRPPATLSLLFYTWPSGALLANNAGDAPQSLFLGPLDLLLRW